MSPRAPSFSPGSLIDGEYRLETPLGRGGFAVVWRARRESTGQRVALKLFHQTLLSPNARARVKRESELLIQLRHPNIAGAERVQLEHQPPYIVLELIEGSPMSELIRRRCAEGRHLALSEIRSLMSQLSLGIHHAHSLGVIHRDLKPANILLGKGEPALVKIVDFGVARLLDTDADRATTQGRILGSYLYMSPEQGRGEQVGIASDVFALATIAFELLTLRRAWARTAEGEHALALARVGSNSPPNTPLEVFDRVSNDERPAASKFRPSLGLDADRVLARALDPNPLRRHEDALEFWSALEGTFPAAEDLQEQNAVNEALTRLVTRVAAEDAIDPTPVATPSNLPASVSISVEPSPTITAPLPLGPEFARIPDASRGRRWLLAAAFAMLGAVGLVGLLAKRAGRPPPRILAPALPERAPVATTATHAVDLRAPPRVEVAAPEIPPPSRPEPSVPRPNRRPGPSDRVSAPPAAEAARPPVVEFERAQTLLRRIQEDAADTAAWAQLRAELVTLAVRVRDPVVSKRIRRRVEGSATVGDPRGMAQALRDLEEELGRSP